MVSVLENTVLPMDFRKMESSMGFAEKVFVEVAVSKVLRKILRMEDKGIFYLTAVHYLSQPVMGGFSAVFGPIHPIGSATVTEALIDGAKGVPAVFFAQYVVNTSLKGLHVPGISLKDAFITAASKAFTRPLMQFLVPKLGVAINKQFQAADHVNLLQEQSSNLRR